MDMAPGWIPEEGKLRSGYGEPLSCQEGQISVSSLPHYIFSAERPEKFREPGGERIGMLEAGMAIAGSLREAVAIEP